MKTKTNAKPTKNIDLGIPPPNRKSPGASNILGAQKAGIRNFENLLLNQPILAFLLGVFIYLPLMSIVVILWMIQSLVAIVIYMIASMLSLCKKTKSADKAINTVPPCTSVVTRSSVTILQFNAFYIFGRFWTRKSMMEDMIRSLSPDIILVNEAIRTRICNFGTFQMINNLWSDTHCDSVVSSAYHQLIDESPSIGKYSFIWDYVLCELRLILNVLFILPFFRSWLWKLLLKGNSIWWDVVLVFTAVGENLGNALIFRGSNIEDPDILPLTENRTANRALYTDPKNENKKLWIVSTHLTSTSEAHYKSAEHHQIEQIELVLKWMEKAVSEHPADALVIGGDFNAIPDSEVYRLMENNGFRSCGCEYLGKGQYITYESVTWTLSEGIDEDVGVGKSLILDYVWIKPLRKGMNIRIEDCRIVGKDFVNLQHRGKDIRVYPSDHYGVFVTLSW